MEGWELGNCLDERGRGSSEIPKENKIEVKINNKEDCKEYCMNIPLATACEHFPPDKCIVHTYSIGKTLGKNRNFCALIQPKGISIIAKLSFSQLQLQLQVGS